MSAVVTDQFRILNASNFINSAVDNANSYYVFLGLDNPTSIVFPLIPIEIGELDLVNPDILPQENLPTGFDVFPEVESPITDVFDFILQVIIPTVPLEENC